jgi:TolB-like protein/class 3 adenylate cyclase/Flp pilus assembly protein TadD
MASANRRLAAILFSDIVGYTALMGESEKSGLRVRRRHRRLLRDFAARYRGSIVDENGDELVLIFPSALSAASCALAAQAALADDPELKLRIGIHLGDVIFEGQRIYGDGVNVASRIRPFAQPGGVAVSEPVFDALKNQSAIQATPLGEHALKNVSRVLAVYSVTGSPELPSSTAALRSEPWVRRLAIGAAVAVALGGTLYLAKEWQGARGAVGASVAVLPFADTGSGGDQAPFADGMTDEIIAALARIPGLRVVGRTSAFAFKGRDVDIRTIGQQLGVRYLVEGTVEKAGDQVRVVAELVSAADGYQVWSERYDRKLSDIFAIQSDIAAKAAGALAVHIAERPPEQPPHDLRAYELYLTGRQLWSLRTEAGMRRAIDYFERALSFDPNDARALSGIADARTMLSVYRFDTDPDAIERAREAALAALAADPASGDPHASLGRLQFAGGTWNWKQAEEHLLRAIEMSPGNVNAHQWYAAVLMNTGRVKEGLREIQRALELDPLSPVVLRFAGSYTSLAGDHERGIDLLRRAVDLDPESLQTRLALVRAYLSDGKEREAAETALAGMPSHEQAILRGAYETSGPRAALEALLRSQQERTGQDCPPQPATAAAIHAYLQDAEGVFRCLREGEETGDGGPILDLDPLFAPFRSDPRYTAHLEATGRHQ